MDETVEIENNISVNRRSLLKTLGTTGSVAVFGTVSSAAARASSTERHVNRRLGKEEQKIIDVVKDNNEVGMIFQFIEGEGWEPEYSDGRYGTVKTDNNEFKIASVPLQSPSKNENQSAVLRWSQEIEKTAEVIILNQDESIGNQERDFKERTIWVEDGDVESNTIIHSVTTTDDDSEFSTQRHIGPSGGGSGICYRCGCEKVVTRHCEEWDMTCIGWRIVFAGLSCLSGNIMCVIGALADAGTIITGDACKICDKYDVDRTKVGYACS